MRTLGDDRRAAMLLLALVAASTAVYAVRVLVLPLGQMTVFVPDDAFYYLVLAKHFAQLGRWTFDGTTNTTGFHLLHPYGLALVYKLLAPGKQAFATVAVALSALGAIAALVPAVLHSRDARRGDALWAAVLVASSPNFAANAVGAVEWRLALVAGSLYLRLLYVRGGDDGARLPLFVTGCLGSLARSDFGLLPGCMFLAALAFAPRDESRRDESRRYRNAAAIGLLGAATGLGLVLAHNFAIAGTLVQTSARIKYHWATLLPADERLRTVLLQLADVLTGLKPSTTRLFNLAVYASGAVIAALALRAAFRRRADSPGVPVNARGIVIGSLLALAGYTAFYMRNGEVQVWYSSAFIAPLACLVTATLAALGPRQRMALVALIAVLTIRNVVLVQVRTAHPMPWQRVTFAAGEVLARNPDAARGRIGSWNAGLMGYAQGGTIVNLDGLVNNEVYPYIVGDRLACYLARRDIRRLADADVMFEKKYAARGGYSDGLLVRSLGRREAIATDRATGRTIFLFDVDLDSIRRDATCSAPSPPTR